MGITEMTPRHNAAFKAQSSHRNLDSPVNKNRGGRLAKKIILFRRLEKVLHKTSQSGMRSRDICGRLRLRLRLRGSIPALAPAPAPSKTVRRLRLRLRIRAKCTDSGGSGSGSGSDDQVFIGMSLNQQYDFQKCQMSKYDFLLTWP